jgi:hypothetical protein
VRQTRKPASRGFSCLVYSAEENCRWKNRKIGTDLFLAENIALSEVENKSVPISYCSNVETPNRSFSRFE